MTHISAMHNVKQTQFKNKVQFTVASQYNVAHYEWVQIKWDKVFCPKNEKEL